MACIIHFKLTVHTYFLSNFSHCQQNLLNLTSYIMTGYKKNSTKIAEAKQSRLIFLLIAKHAAQ